MAQASPQTERPADAGHKPRKELTDDERMALFLDLLGQSREFILPHGAMKSVAKKYSVSYNTAARACPAAL